MKTPKAIDSIILTVRGQRVILDADLAGLYGVTTKALNQAVKRHTDRFPEDFAFRLTGEEKLEVVTNCDHLARLKFSPQTPMAFTEHGAIMAASILNSPEAVAMSVFVVRAFVQMREQLAVKGEVMKRLAEMDHKLLKHDQALNLIWQQIQRKGTDRQITQGIPVFVGLCSHLLLDYPLINPASSRQPSLL